jgi:hypothetical protein
MVLLAGIQIKSSLKKSVEDLKLGCWMPAESTLA